MNETKEEADTLTNLIILFFFHHHSSIFNFSIVLYLFLVSFLFKVYLTHKKDEFQLQLSRSKT